MKTKFLIVTIFCFFIFLLLGIFIFERYHERDNVIKYSDKYLRNINGNFITMTEAQQNFIKKNIENIKKGISVEEMLKNLGEPTYIQMQGTKEGKFLGWVYEYYFVLQDEHSVKTTDKSLSVFIDADKRVNKIGTNIEELRMKNWGDDFYLQSIEEIEATHGIK